MIRSRPKPKSSFRHRVLTPIQKSVGIRISIYFTFWMIALSGLASWHIHHLDKRNHDYAEMMKAEGKSTSYTVLGDLSETLRQGWTDGVPVSVLINGQLWTIGPVDHFADSTPKNAGNIMAETFCEDREIAYIHAEDPARLRVNIWHEIFHAGACLHDGDSWWNTEDGAKDHPGIYHLGEFMAEFTLANPKFMEWANSPYSLR